MPFRGFLTSEACIGGMNAILRPFARGWGHRARVGKNLHPGSDVRRAGRAFLRTCPETFRTGAGLGCAVVLTPERGHGGGKDANWLGIEYEAELLDHEKSRMIQ